MSSFDNPAIITCSISGAVANRDQCPAIPYTPEEYASEARRIVDEGGVHIHIHARKPDGTPGGTFRSRTRSEAWDGPCHASVKVHGSSGSWGLDFVRPLESEEEADLALPNDEGTRE